MCLCARTAGMRTASGSRWRSASASLLQRLDARRWPLRPDRRGTRGVPVAVTLCRRWCSRSSGVRTHLDQLNLLVMHQANLRINEAVSEEAGVARGPGLQTTSFATATRTAATIPIALHEAMACGGSVGGASSASSRSGRPPLGAALYRLAQVLADGPSKGRSSGVEQPIATSRFGAGPTRISPPSRSRMGTRFVSLPNPHSMP